ncbi:MAG: CPBP family intramembrane metalloprotease [Verrucomicrobia bacterium]|nr:CPBP family intramembrane metalloprotease [Verrucomicrobiota bacterium]
MKNVFALFGLLSFFSAAYAVDEISLNYQPTSQISVESLEMPKPILAPTYKSPGLAVGLSAIIPGLGHVYLDDSKTAGALMGSYFGGLGATAAGFMHSRTAFEYGMQTMSTASMYGMYAAYRDARNHNGPSGYSYKMPNDSFLDLAYASFDSKVLRKPEVWGGYLGAFAVAIGSSLLFDSPKKEAADIAGKKKDRPTPPIFAFPVGISEEALFRGFLQSALMESLDPLGGIALSALIFGASHAPNALLMEDKADRRDYYTYAIPFITAFGAYMGWVTYKNQSLKESVALHAWYDLTIFLAEYAIHKSSAASASLPPSRFSVAIPF